MASRIPADIQRNKAVDFDRQLCRRYKQGTFHLALVTTKRATASNYQLPVRHFLTG